MRQPFAKRFDVKVQFMTPKAVRDRVFEEAAYRDMTVATFLTQLLSEVFDLPQDTLDRRSLLEDLRRPGPSLRSSLKELRRRG